MYSNRLIVNPMTDDQLRQYAPAIFAERAHESRSDRYQFIPTIAIVDQMRDAGFFPVRASQSSARTIDKKLHTKHVIRFRSPDASVELDGLIPEFSLLGSSDGTSAHILDAAIFRNACYNGLIVKQADIDCIRVRHSGNAAEKIVQGTHELLSVMPRVMESIDNMRSINLDHKELAQLAQSAARLRWEAETEQVDLNELVTPQRQADKSRDLWTAFNILQERVLKGQANVRNIETGKARKAREVKSVTENTRLNKELWQIAAFFAEQKRAA